MQETKFEVFSVEKDDYDLYKLVEEDKNFALNYHPEIFLLSACIGYKYNLREKINKREQLTRKAPVLNLENAAVIFDAFKCIAIENNEIDEDGNFKVNIVMEEYAKGGFRKLYNEVFSKTGNRTENLLNYLMLNLG